MFTLPVTLLQPATVVCVNSRPGFAGGADSSATYAIGKNEGKAECGKYPSQSTRRTHL